MNEFIWNLHTLKLKLYADHNFKNFEVYAKISLNFYTQIGDISSCFDVLDESNYEKHHTEGIAGEIFGVKIIITSQKNDYEFLIKPNF